MAQPDREAVYAALLSLLTATVGPTAGGGNNTFLTVQRRFITIFEADQAMAPYLIQTQIGEEIKTLKGVPSKRTFNVLLYCYIDFGGESSVVPDTALNNLVTQLEAALAPNAATGYQQLTVQGVQVSSVVVNGKVDYLTNTGNANTWAMCVVPVEIVATY